MIDKIISHYKILEKLGRGGMGVVYKAQDLRLDRFVALKFLPPHLDSSEEEKKRFMHEAKAASGLEHQNICNIHEIDETEDGQLFICMAYYDGETLKKRIERSPLLLEELLSVAIQIAEGLAKAHSKGILHRDIKPANIMITSEGQVKIVDFGLAKLVGHSRLTKSGGTVGTVAYMSPEQGRGEETDQRTDIWSLGVVVYEMLTGRLPFPGEYEQAVIYSILNEDPKPIAADELENSDHLWEVICKALEKDPAQRFQETDELRMALKHLYRDLQISGKSERDVPRQRVGHQRRLLLSNFRNNKAIRKLKSSPLLILGPLMVIAAITLAIIKTQSIDGNEKVWDGQRLSIAVLYFSNNTGDANFDRLSEAMPDILITDLNQSKYLEVISKEKLFEILRQIGYEQNTALDKTVAVEIAQRASAQMIVTGSIIKIGEMFRISANIDDLSAEPLIKTEKIEGTSIDIHKIAQLSSRVKVALEIEAIGRPEITEGIDRTKANSVEAYNYYMLGNESIDKGYYEEAISNLTEAIRIDSTFAHAYDALSNVYDVLGEQTLAKDAIKKAISFSGKLEKVEQLRILLRDAQLEDQWDQAVDFLKQLTVRQPDEAYLHFRLGWIYADHKRLYEQSVHEYSKAIEIDPEGEPVFYDYLGASHLSLGRPEEAITAQKKYVALLPDDANSHNDLGGAYLLTGDYEKASHEFDRALEMRPEFSHAIKNIGDLHLALGKNREALRYYQKYHTQAIGKSQEAAGHYYQAKYHLINGQFDQAAEEARRVLDSEPKYWPVSKVEAYWLLGLVAIKQGNLDSAEVILHKQEDLLESLSTRYKEEFFHHLKGRLYLAHLQFDSAIAAFEQALNLGPSDQPFFRQALADAYFESGRLDDAVAAYNKVLEFNPNYAYSHYMLGQAYQRKNLKREAIDHYGKFLEIWMYADEDRPLLQQARTRLAELKVTS
jgi:serine/threonine protein kinase/predicted Zn-dependent protease